MNVCCVSIKCRLTIRNLFISTKKIFSNVCYVYVIRSRQRWTLQSWLCVRTRHIYFRSLFPLPLTVRSNRSAHLNARPHFIFYDYVINNFVIIISFVCVLLILLLLYYNMLAMWVDWECAAQTCASSQDNSTAHKNTKSHAHRHLSTECHRANKSPFRWIPPNIQ